MILWLKRWHLEKTSLRSGMQMLSSPQSFWMCTCVVLIMMMLLEEDAFYVIPMILMTLMSFFEHICDYFDDNLPGHHSRSTITTR